MGISISKYDDRSLSALVWYITLLLNIIQVHLLSEKLLQKGNDPITPVEVAACKQEDASSYSSHVLEADQMSDFEQGDKDDEYLVQRLCLPKLEAEYYDDHLQPNSCNLGFPVQNQGTWFWQCWSGDGSSLNMFMPQILMSCVVALIIL